MTRARPSGPAKLVRDALTRNVGLKVLSLAAAVGLFSVARGAEDQQASVFTEVVAVLPSTPDKVLLSELPDRVRVTVRGGRAVLNSVLRRGLDPVPIDLTDTRVRSYQFRPDAFEVPAGATVVQVVPSSIPLVWADRVARQVRVEPRISGELAPELALVAAVRADPPEIRLVGPEAEVGSLTRVRTVPVEVTGLGAGTHRVRVALERLPAHSTVAGDPSIELVLEVGARQVERTLRRVGVEIVGAARATARPARVAVTLRGPAATMESLDEELIVPTVEAGAAPAGAAASPAPIRVVGLPAGVELVRVDPAEVLLVRR